MQQFPYTGTQLARPLSSSEGYCLEEIDTDGRTAHQPVPLHPYGIRSPIASAPNDKRGDITVDVTSLSIDSSEDRTGQDPPRILYVCQSCRLLLALETLLERSELVEVA